MIYDPDLVNTIERKRKARGLDRHDEAWNGVNVALSPPNDEQQQIVAAICCIIQFIYNFQKPPEVRAGINVSDRIEGWEENYRCPDVAVNMNRNPAVNCGTHWHAGLDFLVEIIGPGDPTRKKLPFYASIKSREVLIVNRSPWELELYQLQGEDLVLAGKSSLSEPNVLTSSVLPLTFRLVAGESRPQIEIVHATTGQSWRV
jgi:Uma2 family endonuclease